MESEPFLQIEVITSRLNAILKEYQPGSQLYEILQNADDAEATEVAFFT